MVLPSLVGHRVQNSAYKPLLRGLPFSINIWFNQTRGTVKALREILKWSGFSVQGVLQKGGTKQHHELTMKELQKCKTLIKRLTI